MTRLAFGSMSTLRKSTWSRSAPPLPLNFSTSACENERKDIQPLATGSLPVSRRTKVLERFSWPEDCWNLPPKRVRGSQVTMPMLPPLAPTWGASESGVPWVTKSSHMFSASVYSCGNTEKLPEAFTGAPSTVKPIWSELKPRTRMPPPNSPVASKLKVFTPGRSCSPWYGLDVARCLSSAARVVVERAFGASSWMISPVPSLSPSPMMEMVSTFLASSSFCCANNGVAAKSEAMAMERMVGRVFLMFFPGLWFEALTMPRQRAQRPARGHERHGFTVAAFHDRHATAIPVPCSTAFHEGAADRDAAVIRST